MEKYCGGCGESDPAKRCIGCLAEFGEGHLCFICNQPFKDGEMVLMDITEGLGHRACFGDDRDAYVSDLETGAPLSENDPIPTGQPYVSGEWV